MSPNREEILLSGARTTIDGTEAEAREWERDRVAWNLPRDVRVDPSRLASENPEESRELDPMQRAAEDG